MTAGSNDQPWARLERKRVLIVDDDELVRVMVREIFERFGVIVSIATNGRLAIAAMAEQKPDLVVLDIIMPEKEGLETLLQIKRDYADVKVIAISSGGRKQLDDFLVIADRFGADVVLKKPIRPSVLLSHATQLLWGAPPVQEQIWKAK
jgi:CheY-like chemotaxis protein